MKCWTCGEISPDVKLFSWITRNGAGRTGPLCPDCFRLLTEPHYWPTYTRLVDIIVEIPVEMPDVQKNGLPWWWSYGVEPPEEE